MDSMMRYLSGYNFYINRNLDDDSDLHKEEIDTKLFEDSLYHDHTNIYHTFCSLTHKTYPYGTEDDVLKYIKHPLQMDKHGNYFIKIGESQTMFSSHLDTATNKRTDVKLTTYDKKDHKYICTDGKTILGADDKAGVTIMLYMIEHNIPGIYYFFIGEERGGIGSGRLADSDDKEIKKIKRCISFDRYGYNSIITHQAMERCCSDIFANALCEELNNQGMKYRKDDTGVFTDSANFIGLIKECTNVSVGYFHEHSVKEYQNITFLEQLCKAVVKVDWENLPIQK